MTEPIRECPYCRELVNASAIKCPRCFTVLDRAAYLRESLGGFGHWIAERLEWSRRQQNKKFLGVCSAIGTWTGIPLLPIRALFVYLSLTGNHGLLAYVLLFLFMPDRKQAELARQEKTEE